MLTRNQAAAAGPVEVSNAASMRLVDSTVHTIGRSPDDGAATTRPAPSRTDIVELLNDSLATELVCVLRYKRHHFTADGLTSPRIAQEFLVHANEESVHADRLARRIVQLGGKPDFSPESLGRRSHAAYDDSSDLKAMIRSDLIAERVGIEIYRQAIALIGDNDAVSRHLLEDIVCDEQAHAEELQALLAD